MDLSASPPEPILTKAKVLVALFFFLGTIVSSTSPHLLRRACNQLLVVKSGKFALG